MTILQANWSSPGATPAVARWSRHHGLLQLTDWGVPSGNQWVSELNLEKFPLNLAAARREDYRFRLLTGQFHDTDPRHLP